MNEQTDVIMTLKDLSESLKTPKSILFKLVQKARVQGPVLDQNLTKKIGKKLGKRWRFSKNAINQWSNKQPKKVGAN